MALILTCSAPSLIRASCRSESVKKSDPNRKKSVSWWAPLFGLSTDPDYLNIESSNPEIIDVSKSDQEPDQSGQRIRRGCLTEEKAKQLRRKIAEASTFHDVMYRSAIASRLASDTSGRRVEEEDSSKFEAGAILRSPEM